MRQDVFRALNNAFSQFDYSRDLVDTGPVPFMTGRLDQDSFVYYAEQNYGVKLDLMNQIRKEVPTVAPKT